MRFPVYMVVAAALATAFACPAAVTAEDAFRPPLFREDPPQPRPEVAWQEPRPLALPSDEDLATTTVSGRTYRIVRVSPRAVYGGEQAAAVARTGLAIHEDGHEALCFVGTGSAGRRSRERLVIEDCTFLLDFADGDFATWDERRCAVFVRGYREVLIRRCAFVAKGRPDEPVRRTMASIAAYDCLRVQIEDCGFAGLTNWMRGHITVFCCGPTTVRRVEVHGLPLLGQPRCGGGIWVANGVGEDKLGSVHDDPALMIYPSGPLIVREAWVHDHHGRDNTDGIYVQSIHPYHLRDCRVERWATDGLVDVGYRDSARGSWRGRRLANHGQLGLIERCDFAEGYVKCSVGLGGGLVFRENRLRDAWLYPYVFDGGGWWVVSNVFEDQRSVLLSGMDGQLEGWSAREGMLVGGSRMHWHNNRVEAVGDRPLFVGSEARTSSVRDQVEADWNSYRIDGRRPWARDTARGETAADLAAWRAWGKDRASVVDADRSAFAALDPGLVILPGGMRMTWGEVPAGTSGAVGIGDAPTRARFQRLASAIAGELARDHALLEAETLPAHGPGAARVERASASGGAYLALRDPTEFVVVPPAEGRFRLAFTRWGRPDGGRWRVELDGQPVAELDFAAHRPGTTAPLPLRAAGERLRLTRLSGGGTAALDSVVLTAALPSSAADANDGTAAEDGR